MMSFGLLIRGSSKFRWSRLEINSQPVGASRFARGPNERRRPGIWGLRVCPLAGAAAEGQNENRLDL
jgi:hypothetical protein